MAKLGFKDFMVVDYRPGEPEEIKYRDLRQRRTSSGGGPVSEKKKKQHQDPLATGKHAPNIGMGWTGKHTTVKDPSSSRHTHVFQYTEQTEDDVEEALTMQQRLARSRQAKRLKSKLKMGRKRAAKRIASKEKLEVRARRKAREMILKRLTKDVPKSELTYARRQELEKRLDKMKSRIDRIAKKMLPKVRQAELAKKRK